MNKKKLNVAVIGLGIGIKHIEAYLSCKHIGKIGVFDFDKKKILSLKKKFSNLKIYNHENEIFNDQDVKIVSIASFDNYHFRQIIKCYKYRKHFVVEKPICENIYELKKIKKLVKKYPEISFTSNLPLRTEKLFFFFKKKIKKANPYYIEADYLWGRYKKLFGWRSKLKNYSIINGAAIHVIDLVLWLIEKKPSHIQVFSNNITTKNTIFKKKSFSLILLFFSNGLIVKLTANVASRTPHFHSLKIYDKDLTISHDFSSTSLISSRGFSNLNLNKYPYKVNRKKIIKSFVASLIDKKKKPLVNRKYLLYLTHLCLCGIKSEKLKLKIKI